MVMTISNVMMTRKKSVLKNEEKKPSHRLLCQRKWRQKRRRNRRIIRLLPLPVQHKHHWRRHCPFPLVSHPSFAKKKEFSLQEERSYQIKKRKWKKSFPFSHYPCSSLHSQRSLLMAPATMSYPSRYQSCEKKEKRLGSSLPILLSKNGALERI